MLHDGERELPAVGFGAVFTRPEFRGRGYASVMLAAELDRSRAEGYEIAYLFSDIRPQFYTPLGFRAFASNNFTLPVKALPTARMHPTPLRAGDWRGIMRCFDAGEAARDAGFLRTAPDWSWIRMRMRQGSELAAGSEYNLVLRRSRGISAYVLGARIPERDTYILDEYGFSGEASAESIPALLRAAAGDLRRVAGWMPPDEFRRLLPKGSSRKRTRSILMMAPLGARGAALIDRLAPHRGAFCWATEHI